MYLGVAAAGEGGRSGAAGRRASEQGLELSDALLRRNRSADEEADFEGAFLSDPAFA